MSLGNLHTCVPCNFFTFRTAHNELVLNSVTFANWIEQDFFHISVNTHSNIMGPRSPSQDALNKKLTQNFDTYDDISCDNFSICSYNFRTLMENSYFLWDNLDMEDYRPKAQFFNSFSAYLSITKNVKII